MRLAADANVLLSAVLGGRARAVFEHPTVEEVFTAEPTLAEVQEYAPVLAKKKRVARDGRSAGPPPVLSFPMGTFLATRLMP